MRNIDAFARSRNNLFPALRCWVVLATGLLLPGCALAQSAPAKAPAASSSPGDFSIETEMLTYSALESNSEAVACDVAAYLNKTSANFTNPPFGTVCSVNAGATSAKVLIYPFDRTEFNDFQIWRADMATMAQMRDRAKASYQCPKGASARGATAAASTAGSIAASLSPYGAMAETALSIMSTAESATSVVGTIQDQAFMDGVARQLRSLHVQVLMPSAYTPFGFIADDEAHSPFMTNLDKLIDARTCLAEAAVNDENKDKAGAAQMGKDIDDFFKSLSESVPAPANPNAPKPASAATTTTTTTPPPPPLAPTHSHLSAALSADGLAQKLGLDLTTGTLPNRTDWPHILLLKALESGGAVSKSSSLLKTTMSYSGGSVATYTLFRLDGEVECSGNVFDFTGSVPSKHFSERFHESKIDPAKQLIFLRGSCTPPSQ